MGVRCDPQIVDVLTGSGCGGTPVGEKYRTSPTTRLEETSTAHRAAFFPEPTIKPVDWLEAHMPIPPLGLLRRLRAADADDEMVVGGLPPVSATANMTSPVAAE